jgi:3D (Asp-Asp-Asp) domain-containing protein
MLAAPKHYEFGTVIHLEGLGTGTVDDRGGAIVKAGERGYEHDRIDVWMGYGDEGLRKALAWGKRKIK